jgi:predicted transcriptional regulator
VREFGELEMAIMDVVWAANTPCTTREVRERMRYGRPVAYTTVMTVMDILYRKGVLQRVKHGRAWQYWPVERREEHDARVMTEVLRSGGDEAVTMRHFLERVSDDELDRLRSAVLSVARGTLPSALDAARDSVLETKSGDTGSHCADHPRRRPLHR